jgi:hypothetical protein
MSGPRTLYDKIWDDHLVDTQEDGTSLLYIDLHLVHEVTSPGNPPKYVMPPRPGKVPGGPPGSPGGKPFCKVQVKQPLLPKLPNGSLKNRRKKF